MRFLYQFAAGTSLLHRLDPRSKLVLVACLAIGAFVFPHPWLMPFVPILLLWSLGNISPRLYLGIILFMLPLVLVILLLQLAAGGPPYYPIRLVGFVPISVRGLQIGLELGFRLLTMGIAFILFSATTDPFDWGLAMYRAGMPYRVAFMFAFAMRFFPLLQEELAVISDALAARGCESLRSRNPLQIIKGGVSAVMPLGMSALRRSQSIALAMEMRGFGYAEEAGIARTLFRDVRLRPRDWAAMAFSVLGLGAVFAYADARGSLRVTWLHVAFAGGLAALVLVVGTIIGRAITAEGGRQPSPGTDRSE